jgi:hypothetical protein
VRLLISSVLPFLHSPVTVNLWRLIESGRNAMSLLSWNLHGNGNSIKDGEVVKPDERLAWPLTIGVGVQHIAAMFGATFLVPIIDGLPT